jgi:endonuclease/exonuclease/phosphatase (EEP) superfamily protein YafD
VLALLLAGAYFLIRRRWALLLPALALLAYVGWQVADYLLPHASGAVGHDKWQLRVMSLNVEAGNDRTDLVKTAIEQANPDLVFVPEGTTAWADALAPLRARYRYDTGDGAHGAFSVLLLSQLPVRDAQVVQLSDDGWPAVIAHLSDRGGGAESCIGFVGIHPPPPCLPALPR